MINSNKIIKTIIFLIMLIPMLATAQIEIKGIVIDGKTPVIFASVELKNSENKTINGVVTDDDGKFVISYVDEGKSLVINFIGLKEKVIDLTTQQLDNDIDLGTIILEEDAQYLEEVVVNAEKKLIEYKIDKIVLNIENNVIASSGDAIDAINTAPGVLVQDNAISMLGRGSSRVMVDDRIINLGGEDLVAYLNSIPGSSIKSIEIIKNPPAKYEAQGNGGLINIILKKAKSNSWNNSTSLSYDQNRYSFGNLSNNFVYNKDKLSFTINVNGRKGAVKALENFDFIYPDSKTSLESVGRKTNDDISGRLSVDYDFNDKLSAGVQYSGRFNDPDLVDKEIRTTNFDNTNSINSIFVGDQNFDNDNENHSLNTHVIYKLDTLGRKVSLDLDYFDFDSKKDYRTISNELDSNMNIIDGQEMFIRDFSLLGIENKSINLAVEHPMSFMNLSYGAKYSIIDSKSDYTSFGGTVDNQIENDDLRDQFTFEEQTYALYLNGNKKIGDKLSVQFGLRLETTFNDGKSISGQNNEFDYSRLFPSLYIDYRINDDNSMNFNYGKRIDRPQFNELNPYRYQSGNLISQGNPFLRPSFIDTFDFTYSYKSKFSTNIFLTTASNGYDYVNNPTTTDNIVLREPLNFFKFHNYGIGEIFNSKINSWWKTNTAMYLLRAGGETIADIDTEILDGFQFYFSSNNSFTLGKNTRLQLNYYYNSAHKRLLIDRDATSRLNVGVNQSFLKNKLKLSLVFNDIFNDSRPQNLVSVVNGVRNVINADYSVRSVRFTMSYSFGNTKIRGGKKRSGNKEELGRSGN
ncbi:TonB-dependent receptor domain-containing protein [Aquimarina litoralis]|uniref:TonB-dependent receptor domain-containing protein n=1 Tax=Aquimarina litoralis TaxID=584605 RepID=UPI001C5625EF|nr:outer membrane beta-barrel family protein [Aquimarina litoralis]MBW1295671.1 outer membrane beta-barrel protein [Aquimarina litoralis]